MKKRQRFDARIIFYFVSIALFGSLLVYFYQFFTLSKLQGLRPLEIKGYILLSGWQGQKDGLIGQGALQSEGAVSTLAFDLREQIPLEIRFDAWLAKDRRKDVQEISVYFNNTSVYKFTLKNEDMWRPVKIGIDAWFVKQGFNKLRFVHKGGSGQPVSYRNIQIRNKYKFFTFGYAYSARAHGSLAPDGRAIRGGVCFLWGFIFALISLGTAFLFFGLFNVSLTRALKSLWSGYAWCIFFFSSVYSLAAYYSYKVVFLKTGFIFSVGFVILSSQAAFLYRNAKFKDAKIKILVLLQSLLLLQLDRVLAVVFIITLSVCGFFLSVDKAPKAEALVIWPFFLFFLAILLKLIKYLDLPKQFLNK